MKAATREWVDKAECEGTVRHRAAPIHQADRRTVGMDGRPVTGVFLLYSHKIYTRICIA